MVAADGWKRKISSTKDFFRIDNCYQNILNDN